MMRIAFATNNAHKLDEVRRILAGAVEVVSLADIGCHADIPETGDTLEENAMQKARYVYGNYGISVFADDTGLEVDALGGAPGVRSARYAGGAGHDSEANMARLLAELSEINDRRARFRTVIALIEKVEGCAEPRVHTFEGCVYGEITRGRRGDGGFGYDPLFRPDGYDKTFAELGAEVKNGISHRAEAVRRLAHYLLGRGDATD